MVDKNTDAKKSAEYKSVTSAFLPLSRVAEDLGLAGEAAAKELMRTKKINIFKKDSNWCIDKASYIKLMSEHTHEITRVKLVEQNKTGSQEHGRGQSK